jgi:protein-disulfide isomerase
MISIRKRLSQSLAVLLFACVGPVTPYAQEPNIRDNQDAPVTILVFSAFTCPYCAEARKTLEQVQAKYPGKVNVIFKHFPLGEDQRAYLPHEAALAAAEQGKFWEMHDALFAHQADLGERNKIEALARQLKLDIKRFNESLDQHAGMSRIKADKAEANALRVKVTPTFYIDGYKFDGMQQTQVFEMMILHILSAETKGEKYSLDGPIKSSWHQPASTLSENLRRLGAQ